MKRQGRHVLLAMCLPFFLLTGCALLESPAARLVSAAAQEGFTQQYLQGGDFELFSLQRFTAPHENTLTVYVEGDGRSWRNRSTPSSDPTPSRSVVYELARRDHAPNVLYLARPCQYLDANALQHCSVRYWTQQRFAPEVVEGYLELLQALIVDKDFREVTLIGYSGGGMIAMLVASRLSVPVKVVTVASVLDHKAWTDFHRVSPLVGSMDLMAAVPVLGRIRQLHLMGSEDQIVPPLLNDGFLAALPRGTPVTTRIVQGYGHECCWADQWPAWLTENIR